MITLKDLITYTLANIEEIITYSKEYTNKRLYISVYIDDNLNIRHATIAEGHIPTRLSIRLGCGPLTKQNIIETINWEKNNC